MKDYVVIFDLDGTLIDTNTLIHESFKYVFKKYKPGYTLSQEELLSFLGPSLKDSFSRYFDEDMIEELIDCYREHNHASHKQYVSVYPTVYETLQQLHDLGYPLAILTTKHQCAANIGIDLFHLRDYFDVIVCGDQVHHQKPDPEGINKVLQLCQCSHGVMVGDSQSDILAGKNAHIHTIGVDWSPKGTKAILEARPHCMISKMSEVINFVKDVNL